METTRALMPSADSFSRAATQSETSEPVVFEANLVAVRGPSYPEVAQAPQALRPPVAVPCALSPLWVAEAGVVTQFGDAGAEHVRGQSGAHHLDLGQLGHVSPAP
mgnify:CR=1 FL=1